jgi:hypothetical protein
VRDQIHVPLFEEALHRLLPRNPGIRSAATDDAALDQPVPQIVFETGDALVRGG